MMKTDFRKTVLKALKEKMITKIEAKECLKRGFENQELPLFLDFTEKELDPFENYILGLEKMGMIFPLFRDENF